MEIPSGHGDSWTHSSLLFQEENLENTFNATGSSPLQHEISTPDLARCADCGRFFTGSNQSTNLRRHLRSVHGPNDIRCEVEGCGEEFTRSDNLKAHIQLKHTSIEAGKTGNQRSCEANNLSPPDAANGSILNDGMESLAPSSGKDFERARQVRITRACWLCKVQRKRCDQHTPCRQCVEASKRIGNRIPMSCPDFPCFRGDLLDFVPVLMPIENLLFPESFLNPKDVIEDHASHYDIGTILDFIESSSNPISTSNNAILEVSHSIASKLAVVRESDSISLVEKSLLCLDAVMSLARQEKALGPAYGAYPQKTMTEYLGNLNSTMQALLKFKPSEARLQEKWAQIFSSLFILSLILCVESRVLEYDQHSLKSGYESIVALFVSSCAFHESLRETNDVRGFAIKHQKVLPVDEIFVLCDRLHEARTSFVSSPENILQALFATWSVEVPTSRSGESRTTSSLPHILPHLRIDSPHLASTSEETHYTYTQIGTSIPSTAPMQLELADLDTLNTNPGQFSATNLTENEIAEPVTDTPYQFPVRHDLNFHSWRGDFLKLDPSPKPRSPVQMQPSPAWEQILSIWQQNHAGRMPNGDELLALSVVTEIREPMIEHWLKKNQCRGPETSLGLEPPGAKLDLVQRLRPANTCMVKRRIPRPWNKPRDPEKPYSCLSRCGWTFIKKSDWVKHEKINNPEESFSCPAADCRSTFIRKDKLRNHIRSVHALHAEDFNLDSRRTLVQERLDELCGFCGNRCRSWQEWYDHVGAHFEDKIAGGPWTMNRWENPWADTNLSDGTKGNNGREPDPKDMEPEDPGGGLSDPPLTESTAMSTTTSPHDQSLVAESFEYFMESSILPTIDWWIENRNRSDEPDGTPIREIKERVREELLGPRTSMFEDPGYCSLQHPVKDPVLSPIAVNAKSSEVSESSSTSARKFSCRVSGCKKSFGRKGERDKHENTHEPSQWRCLSPGCNAVLSRKDKLREHMKKMHKGCSSEAVDHYLKGYRPAHDGIDEGGSNRGGTKRHGRDINDGGASVGSSSEIPSSTYYDSAFSGGGATGSSLGPTDTFSAWSGVTKKRRLDTLTIQDAL